MRWGYYVRCMSKVSLTEVLRWLCKKIRTKFILYRKKCYDLKRCTYCHEYSIYLYPISFFNSLLPPLENISDVAELFCEHRFDLLGGGWCEVEIESGELYRQNNQITKQNKMVAKSIFAQVSVLYRPIGWQKDFKSGYSWSIGNWYMDVAIGMPGIDIKVPWELARMQHLPLLAQAYSLEHEEKYLLEFQDEILDFIAQNPPQFGVNWRCTMDVGIRIANWVVAYDLFCAYGAVFLADFKAILSNSLLDHGRHILSNLEYSTSFHGNHYLSDIAGLIFVAIHLENNATADMWLAFALQELVSEMKTEFHEDGSNFEASTSYHRLSTEIMVYCTFYALLIPEERRKRIAKTAFYLKTSGPDLHPYYEQEFSLESEQIFPNWYWLRLERALRFTMNLLHADGTVPQIGDNDSGRFLKLSPVYEKMTAEQVLQRYANLLPEHVPEDVYYDENILDHTHLASIHDVLFGMGMGKGDFEARFAAQFRGKVPPLEYGPIEFTYSKQTMKEVLDALPLSELMVQEYVFSTQGDLLRNLCLYPYPGMGVYIFKSDLLYLTARCGEVGQDGNGGHSHNDQLSITLQLDGKDILRDPGTYLYTPDAEQRNKFRSTRAHFTPQTKNSCEQNLWNPGLEGLFSILQDRTQAQVVYIAQDGMIMKHRGFGTWTYRVVKIEENRVLVQDYGKDLIHWEPMDCWSDGYGKKINIL